MVDMLFHEMYFQASVLFWGEILPNFNPKNMWFYTKDLSWKKMTQICQILKESKSKSPDFYD